MTDEEIIREAWISVTHRQLQKMGRDGEPWPLSGAEEFYVATEAKVSEAAPHDFGFIDASEPIYFKRVTFTPSVVRRKGSKDEFTIWGDYNGTRLHVAGPISPCCADEERAKRQAALAVFTDDDLLMELRRRNRLARVETHNVVPGYMIERDGPPEDYQIRHAFRDLSGEVTKKAVEGLRIPGCKMEQGRFDDRWPQYPGAEPDRRYTAVLNFVVEKP